MKEVIQHCLLLSLLAHPLEIDSVLAQCLYKCKCGELTPLLLPILHYCAITYILNSKRGTYETVEAH